MLELGVYNAWDAPNLLVGGSLWPCPPLPPPMIGLIVGQQDEEQTSGNTVRCHCWAEHEYVEWCKTVLDIRYFIRTTSPWSPSLIYQIAYV